MELPWRMSFFYKNYLSLIYLYYVRGPEITLGSTLRKQTSRFVDQWTISTLGNLWSNIISDQSHSYITQQEKQKKIPNLNCVAIITLTTEQAQEFEDLQKAARRKKKVPNYEEEKDNEEQITRPLTSSMDLLFKYVFSNVTNYICQQLIPRIIARNC